MDSALDNARDAVQTASEHTDDATVREQLHSIDEALGDLTGDATLPDDVTEGDRLEELEHQIVKLGDQTDGMVQRQLEVARDSIDRYRQSAAPDWES